MAYVYYVPPTTVPPQQERPFQCPVASSGFFCGPALIFVGGAGALMVGFFERRPVIIWPVISAGAILCSLGVFLARRHVKRWREAERDRQRAMWRTNRGQPRRSGGDGAGGMSYPAFDVPMYCLDAPSRPLIRPSSDRSPRSSQSGTAGNGVGHPHDWCALAIPLKPEEVGDGEYLNWAAMTLVVQPHPKYGLPGQRAGGGGGGGRHDDAGVGDGAADAAVGVLTRTTVARATYSGYSRTVDGRGSGRMGDGIGDYASEPMLSAVSLTLLRSPSLGSRSAHGQGGGGGGGGGWSDRRVGRGSRNGRMGDLLSLFAVVAGAGGGGGDDSRDLNVDENGVELAGLKAMAAQAAALRPPAPWSSAPGTPTPAAAVASDYSMQGSPLPGAGTDAAASPVAAYRANNLSGDPTGQAGRGSLSRAGSLRNGAAVLTPAVIPPAADGEDAVAAALLAFKCHSDE